MILKNNWGQLLVAHACNPTYSGGRDGGSKPVLANSSQDPISKKTQKRAGRGAQGVGSEFKPQYCQKEK
jgi:hypothetical protein